MNTKLILITLMAAANLAHAEDSPLFALHNVATDSSANTKEYILAASDGTSEKLFLETPALLDASALKSAKIVGDEHGKPSISITLTEAGAERFAEITRKHQRLGLIVAGKLRMAPVVRYPIYGGMIMISGNLTSQEVSDIVKKLNQKKPK